MFETEFNINDLLIDYTLSLIADIPEEDFNKEMIPDSITPAWVLGHVAMVAAKAAQSLQLPIGLDERWKLMFGPGSSPKDIDLNISKEHLTDEFLRVYGELKVLLPKVDLTDLEKESSSKFLKPFLPEVQHMISHILTSHLAIHCGQLGMWRKTYGLSNKYGK